MEKMLILAFTLTTALSQAAYADTLSVEMINSTPIIGIPADRPAEPPELADPALIRLGPLASHVRRSRDWRRDRHNP